MLTDSHSSVIISSLGWVDRGSLWVNTVDTGAVKIVPLSSAKYLSLHAGTNDFFSVNHHFDASEAKITVHRYSDPGNVVASANVTPEGSVLDGDLAAWTFVQKIYVVYYTGPFWKDFCLLRVAPQANRVDLQQFDWYSTGYDKGYQGVTDVVEIPNSDLVIISVQRDSRPVLYDPNAQRKVGAVELCKRAGNPKLFFRRRANELWADDYDTIVKLEPGSWRILGSRQLQPDVGRMRQFIGQFSFVPDESLCVVARPFSGDVLGIDPATLQPERRCDLGGKPLEAMGLPDGSVTARDWKSGAFLRGEWQT